MISTFNLTSNPIISCPLPGRDHKWENYFWKSSNPMQWSHLLSSCSFLLASSTSFWYWRWCLNSSSELFAGRPAGLQLDGDFFILKPSSNYTWPPWSDQSWTRRCPTHRRPRPPPPSPPSSSSSPPAATTWGTPRIPRIVQRGGGMTKTTLRSVVGPSRKTRTTLSLCSASHLQLCHWERKV